MYRSKPSPLTDCAAHGPGSGAELFVVEGESAAKAVVWARDPRFQAVLPMQGKPLNAWRASETAVAGNTLYQKLIAAIGAGWHQTLQPANLRFERIVLLCDPDADGIHCGVLLLLFFYRWMRPLLDAGHLGAIHAPLCQITIPSKQQTAYAFSAEHHQRLRAALAEHGVTDYREQRYRGLASMSGLTLSTTCLDPATRRLQSLSSTDAENALAVLNGLAG